MPAIIVLTLADQADPHPDTRVPVLACVEALRRGRAAVVEVAVAGSDQEIDATIKPVLAGEARLVVAAATDGQIRAVVRRMVRHLAPPPSRRSARLAPDRTVFDLPPVALLPLQPGIPDLARRLGLPVQPDQVAAACLAGQHRRLDLLRNDAGSVTLHGVLIGTPAGDPTAGVSAPLTWRGRVEVDAAILTDGAEPVLACAIRNAGATDLGGLPMVVDARSDDGQVHVAIAVPVLRRHMLREASPRIEVRRARGRAVSVTPRESPLALSDDGVAGELSHKRAWWIERGAWAVYG